MEEFIRHIFATLTYRRTYTLEDAWKRSSKDFNRFLQKYRRLHNTHVQYFRVIEEHKDGYPHVHSLLQFPDARIRVSNSRYFESTLYKKWKSLWLSGHSDYQKPRNGPERAIPYLMKYLLKNQTAKTVWKKILADSVSTTLQEEVSPATNVEKSSLGLHQDDSSDSILSSTHLNGVKLCSWSRNFDWKPLKAKPSK